MDIKCIVFSILFVILTPDVIISNNRFNIKRATTLTNLRLWFNGVIPYEIQENYFDDDEIEALMKAMNAWNQETCLNIRPYNNKTDHNWIFIKGGNSGCSSELKGMKANGRQYIKLSSPGCSYYGTYLHELGHVAGLVHEHQRNNRNKYITIDESKIDTTKLSDISAYQRNEIRTLNTPYDIQSIMHYGPKSSGKNKDDVTITLKDTRYPNALQSAPFKDLSFYDVKGVNRLYRCNENCNKNITCVEPGFINKNCTCQSEEDFIQRRCVNDISDAECEELAAKLECILNPRYMSLKCRKSCNYCYQSKMENVGFSDTILCKDYQDTCKINAQNGFCSQSPEYMNLYCCKSCNATKNNI